jgi:hypothetical protein
MHGVSTKMIDGTNLDDDQAGSTVLLIESSQSLCFWTLAPKRQLRRYYGVSSATGLATLYEPANGVTRTSFKIS